MDLSLRLLEEASGKLSLKPLSTLYQFSKDGFTETPLQSIPPQQTLLPQFAFPGMEVTLRSCASIRNIAWNKCVSLWLCLGNAREDEGWRVPLRALSTAHARRRRERERERSGWFCCCRCRCCCFCNDHAEWAPALSAATNGCQTLFNNDDAMKTDAAKSFTMLWSARNEWTHTHTHTEAIN